MVITAPPSGANPFDDSGVRADDHGVRRYPNLHSSLLEMLRDSVGAGPGAAMGEKVGAVIVPFSLAGSAALAAARPAWGCGRRTRSA